MLGNGPPVRNLGFVGRRKGLPGEQLGVGLLARKRLSSVRVAHFVNLMNQLWKNQRLT